MVGISMTAGTAVAGGVAGWRSGRVEKWKSVLQLNLGIISSLDGPRSQLGYIKRHWMEEGFHANCKLCKKVVGPRWFANRRGCNGPL